MDVLGFGLENYNAIGNWRTLDGKFPIDSSGTLPGGKTFQHARPRCRPCCSTTCRSSPAASVEKMLIYALGRGLQPFDRRAVSEINARLASGRLPVPDR